MDYYQLIKGLIPIFGGVYGLLLVAGVLPRNPKDPEQAELWRKKFGPLMTIICPLLIVFGVARLVMGF